MNRRKFLTFAAALLPCSIAAKLFAGTELHGTPSPSAELPPFTPTSGFHIEVRELGERFSEWEGRVVRTPPCFRATIRDCSGKQHICAVNSPFFEVGETDNRRRALDMLYQNIQRVVRQRQFPKDTLIYDTEITVNGVKLMNPRYPDE